MGHAYSTSLEGLPPMRKLVDIWRISFVRRKQLETANTRAGWWMALNAPVTAGSGILYFAGAVYPYNLYCGSIYVTTALMITWFWTTRDNRRVQIEEYERLELEATDVYQDRKRISEERVDALERKLERITISECVLYPKNFDYQRAESRFEKHRSQYN